MRRARIPLPPLPPATSGGDGGLGGDRPSLTTQPCFERGFFEKPSTPYAGKRGTFPRTINVLKTCVFICSGHNVGRVVGALYRSGRRGNLSL